MLKHSDVICTSATGILAQVCETSNSSSDELYDDAISIILSALGWSPTLTSKAMSEALEATGSSSTETTDSTSNKATSYYYWFTASKVI